MGKIYDIKIQQQEGSDIINSMIDNDSYLFTKLSKYNSHNHEEILFRSYTNVETNGGSYKTYKDIPLMFEYDEEHDSYKDIITGQIFRKGDFSFHADVIGKFIERSRELEPNEVSSIIQNITLRDRDVYTQSLARLQRIIRRAYIQMHVHPEVRSKLM